MATPQSHDNPWQSVSSRVAYQNDWIRVREDTVIRPDGGQGIYGVVEIRPSVAVVALNDHSEIALVRQWRYTVGRYTWEVPRGGSSPGETDMLAVAQRELREEAGVEAASWQAIGAVDVCNGVTTDVQHMFLARGLRLVGSEHDPTEDIVIRWVPLEEAVGMAVNGALSEVCSVAAVLRSAHLLGAVKSCAEG